MQSIPALIASFRRRGLKITPQRRAIFQALADDHSHPTTEEIYQRVVSVMPDISRTTVYNTLRELVVMGELWELDLGGGTTRYDTDNETHHHLLCLSCQTVVNIQRDFDGLELQTKETAGYRVVGRQVTFYGYCPNCQQE